MMEINMRKSSSECVLFNHLYSILMSFKLNLPDLERILYAALMPCPQTSNVLKSACRTWEDHM
jgi:hypothetical protein